MIHTDVIIVGGGPAGSACARRLTEQRIRCLVIDRCEFPRAKPCAGWITPAVVKELDLDPSEYPHSFTTSRALTVCIRKLTVTLSNHQHAIRRVEFDHWLLNRSGARVYQHTVKSIVQSGSGYVVDGEFAGQYLVGAGGTYCPVYRTVFSADHPRTRGALIVGLEAEFAYPHAGDDCWLWFWKNLPGYAWYVPKAGGFVNVGVGAWAEALTSSGENSSKGSTRRASCAGTPTDHADTATTCGRTSAPSARGTRSSPAMQRGWPPWTWGKASAPPSAAARWPQMRSRPAASTPRVPFHDTHRG
jgi:flavin-dependent dehydrogenase